MERANEAPCVCPWSSSPFEVELLLLRIRDKLGVCIVCIFPSQPRHQVIWGRSPREDGDPVLSTPSGESTIPQSTLSLGILAPLV